MTEKEQLEQKLNAVRDLIMSAEKSISNAKRLLNDQLGKPKKWKPSLDTKGLHAYENGDETIVEGVFTGEQMLGSDRKMYPVPVNYASKSKIVQGSKLKAIVAWNGHITYKIIEEIPFDVVTGVLVQDKKDVFQILVNEKAYTILTASVTFFDAKVGDTLTVRIPQGKNATYAAVDTLIPKKD